MGFGVAERELDLGWKRSKFLLNFGNNVSIDVSEPKKATGQGSRKAVLSGCALARDTGAWHPCVKRT